MHAVMRNYSGKGAKELFDVIEKNEAEVEKVIRPVKGLAAPDDCGRCPPA